MTYNFTVYNVNNDIFCTGYVVADNEEDAVEQVRWFAEYWNGDQVKPLKYKIEVEKVERHEVFGYEIYGVDLT